MGGGQEALVAAGEQSATTDPVIAAQWVEGGLSGLQERRPGVDPTLAHQAGPERDLASIGVQHIQAYRQHLTRLPGGRRGGTISEGTPRHYLNALGNLFEAVIEEGVHDRSRGVPHRVAGESDAAGAAAAPDPGRLTGPSGTSSGTLWAHNGPTPNAEHEKAPP